MCWRSVIGGGGTPDVGGRGEFLGGRRERVLDGRPDRRIGRIWGRGRGSVAWCEVFVLRGRCLERWGLRGRCWMRKWERRV